MDWPYTPVQDPLRGATRGRRGTRRTVRKPVVAEQLGLYRDEKLERLKCGGFLIAFTACRRDARLNRGVVIRRLRRVRRGERCANPSWLSSWACTGTRSSRG